MPKYVAVQILCLTRLFSKGWLDSRHTLTKPGTEVIKLFSCLSQLSIEFQMLITTKVIKNKDFSCFQTLICCIIMLINVKMPNIVGILTFMSMINFMLS